MENSKLQDNSPLDVKNKIQPITGSVQPLSLDGGEEPLVQVIKKINEVVDYINNSP